MASVQNQVDSSMISYFENYIDFQENLPNNIARIMTQIHEIDTRRLKVTKYLDYCLKKYRKNNTNQDDKHSLLSNFKNSLMQLQDLSDTKICLVQAICDKIDIKSRQLDANYRSAVNSMNSTQSHQTNSNGTNSNSFSNTNGTATSAGRSANLNTSHNISLNHHEHKNNKNEVNNDRNSSTNASKDNTKDSNSNHSNGNSKRASRRSQGSKKDNNHDSNGGSGDDRSSTPVASERGNSGKKATKRALKYGNLKGDGKRMKSSAYYNDSPPNIFDDSLIDPDEPKYCSCQQVSFGEMICCDNSSCPFEWFHFQCVSLQSKPKGRWFCPGCRGERSNIQKK